MRGRRPGAVLAAVAVLACAAGPAPRRAAPLTVGTSGDYAPFSVAGAGGGDAALDGFDDAALDGFSVAALDGFDVAVARAFAADTGRSLAWVRFAWPGLVADVAAGRFAVAMSGVTVRPERSVVGRFSVPVAESGAVVLTGEALAAGGLAGLDRPGARLAVNAGGHLERVARAAFPRATLLALPENDAVRRALAAGEVDAVVTDTLEAPHWERTLPGTVRLGPFTRDRKAYLWGVGSATPDGAPEALDAWLLAREADGTLGRLRARWLGAPGPGTATPLDALLAAMGERLALMPLVAEAKRAAAPGGAVVVRDAGREARVLDAAVEAVARHARAAGAPPPDPDRVRALYRAQIEAAVALQERTLAGPAPPGRPFDLRAELRPALLRLGDRIAWLLVRLDRPPGRAALAAAVTRELGPFGLGPAHRDAWVDAIAGLAQGRAKARANSPAITGSTIDTP